MKKSVIILFTIVANSTGYSQPTNEKVNSIGFSIPVIWNNSNGIYYSTGNRREPTGDSFSYGINVYYSRHVFNNIFIQIGVGYFKQAFNIIRPFNFNGDTVTNFEYSTKKYSYHNIHLQGGIGYKRALKKSTYLNGLITYNLFNSFKQNYVPSGLTGSAHTSRQINNKSLTIGNNISLSAGVEKKIIERITIGANLLIPIITKWNKDEVFYSSLWSDDAQKIAENRFSIGTTISCKYHF